MIKQPSLTRRHYLAASGAGVLALGLGSTRGVAAPETIKQGYQTNIWGMPTYYLMKSGYLEKHSLVVEEFAVPSGNLTMQQMVARQVDLGTYAGQSFIIGHAKGGLVAIALIEHVGKTARITGNLTLRGMTQPVTLDATFNGGYGSNSFDPGGARVGFSAHGTLKRSAFGMAFGIPAPGTTFGVGDDVDFQLEVEFSKPKAS